MSTLGGIVPRWEWRTFGDTFGAAESLLDAHEPERVQESDETYVLSQKSDASVKVRDDLMDVKQVQNAKWLVVWPKDKAAPGATLQAN